MMQRSSTLLIRQLKLSSRNSLCCSASLSGEVQAEPLSTKTPEVVIPPRIERGPTDILKALSSTIRRDSTAAHYRYHDDPYLIPLTSVGKRQFAITKEAGRKAAKWIREEHAEFFQHKLADPFIEAFAPPTKYNENSEVSNEVLRKVIERQEVSNAITVYELMKQKNLEIHPATEQSLLELLCFYNSEEPMDMDDLEERWFQKGQLLFEKPKNTWSDSGYAEKLFHSMKDKTAEAYCAMIQGMASYHQSTRAWNLYNEMREKKLQLTTDAYNSVIASAPFLKEEANARYELLEEILRSMVADRVPPNVGTLNAILFVLSKVSLYRISVGRSLSAISEFRLLGIEPTLGSFFHLLNIHYAKRVTGSSLLTEMVKYLEEQQELRVVDPTDINFFYKAMEVCHEKHADIELGHRIHALLTKPGNGKLIGDGFREALYFRHYFQLVAKTEPIANLMEFYHTLVPHVYNPEVAVLQDVIKSIDLHTAVEHIPQIWSDIRMYERTPKETLAYQLLSVMARHVKPASQTVSEPEQESRLRLLKTATDIWNNLEAAYNNEKSRTQANWSGEPLGHLLTVFLNLDGFQRACKIIEKLDRDGATRVSGFPKIDSLKNFIEACKRNSHAPHALATVNYAVQIGYEEADAIAMDVAKNIPMDQSQRNKLNSIVGKNLFPES